MDRRRKSRTRLLALVLLIALLAAGFSAAQEYPGEAAELFPEGEAPEIQIQTFPLSPVTGGTWMLTVLVDHPVSSGVEVRPGELPPQLSLEQVRTDLRFVRWPARLNQRWTAVEFLFTLTGSGPFVFPPCRVIIEGKYTMTAEQRVAVQDTGKEMPENNFIFTWDKLPASLKTGETYTLVLRLSLRDTKIPFPDAGLFVPAVPANAVVEADIPTEKEKKEGIFLRLKIIPLNGSVFTLPAKTAQYEGFDIHIPELRIPLIPRSSPPEKRAEFEPPAGEAADVSPAAKEQIVRRFPVFTPRGFFKDPLERIYAGAKALWDAGEEGRALALIRKNERDLTPGRALRPLRRQAEAALGLEFSEDEMWRPRSLLLAFFFAGLGFLVLLLSAFFLKIYPFSKKNKVTSIFSRCYKGVFVFLFLCVILNLWGLFSGAAVRFFSGKEKALILETGALRVPDEKGGISVYFNEGEAVLVKADEGGWVWVESEKGSGWVRSETIIYY
jgi:hypothetical protein